MEVDPARLGRWVDGFAERHGTLRWTTPEGEPGVVRLVADDGSVADLQTWPAPDSAAVPTSRRELVGWGSPPQTLGLVLLRRGGYAVGRASGDRLVDHKCGTRYVQSRTAAGGWSQQRFARRRGNQADALVGTVTDLVLDRLGGAGLEGLVAGGDKALVRQVLAEPRLADLTGLPRREFYDIPDPRLTVLEHALRRGRAVRVRLRESASAVGD
ncbi:acVLRF1 family peptidyl-tRNA hydrolase [Ornithinicoccus hortensis]|uniref:acVLRF1 family peptidyl-tRNA hydrolase n=1 Tax=Ornithinicoccus hortensis TaxID=82346 RepID=UPI0011531909|nr:acVLRF1 family peptidyl-tRNA hydrolase [Ornithinicoccus hortensis]